MPVNEVLKKTSFNHAFPVVSCKPRYARLLSIMGFETLVSVVNLLSSIITAPNQELVFIGRLNRAFSFDHNIFLLHSFADVNRFVSSTNQVHNTPQCLFRFDDNITALEVFQNRTAKNELLIVVPDGWTNFDSNLNVMSMVKKIQRLNINLKIGMFFAHMLSDDDLEELFKWCWSHRIINIFAAFRQHPESLLNVVNFNPFGTFDLINVTESESVYEMFPPKITNFQQHQFRLAVIDNESLVEYSSTVAFTDGPDEMLWNTVLSVLNATYSIYWVRDNLDPVDALDNGTVDIHGDLTDIMNQRIVTIYPMVLEIVSIVVPETKPYSTFEAYLRMATSSNLFAYTLFMLVAVLISLMCSRYVNYRKFLTFQCVADVVNILLNENSAIKYQLLTFSEMCLFIPMTFAGFIIVNGFLSSLKSHVTRPIMQPQIQTADDLYRSPLPMTTPNEYWLAKDAEMLNRQLKQSGNFGLKIRIIDYPDFVQQILTEVQFSFAEYDSIAKFMCKHKRYHITPIQLQRIWYSHNVRYDFPFIDRVNEIIQRITTAGLYEKWWTDATVEDKLFRSVVTEAHTDRFSAPVFIIYGWVAGIVVFLIELSCNAIKNKKK